MNEHPPTLYYGSRTALNPGEPVPPRDGFVHFTPNLDAAIWAAELSAGSDAPRVYTVTPTGPIEDPAQPRADDPAPRRRRAGRVD